MDNKNLTISDIARLAGVAKSTVSRVLNNSGAVSSKTKEKINQIIHEYNYVPSASAKELSQARSNSIGIFIGDVSNQYFQELLKGIDMEIHDSPYFSFICIANSQERQELYLEEMIRRRARGIIFASTEIYNNDSVKEILKSVKVVSVQTYMENNTLIDVDNYNMGYIMAQHLIDMGHTKVGYLQGKDPIRSLIDRLEGFLQAFRDNGIPVKNVKVREFFENAILPDETVRLFTDRSVTALQCCNDNMALYALKLLKTFNMRVPEDMSLSGFDDLPNDVIISPKLTTVRQPLIEIGRTAAKKMISLLDGEDDSPEYIVLPSHLVVRESVKDIRNL